MSDVVDAKEAAFAKMIRERLYYARDTGSMMWRDGSGTALQAFHSSKSAVVSIDGVTLSAARIVWLWHWGRMPPQRLRHINESSFDTHFENLGFFDKSNMIKGAGSRWGVCVPDRWGPYAVAYFDSYYSALASAESVRRAYSKITMMKYDRRGKPSVVNVPSPWTKHVFREGEWEARDLV